ncbi:MAG: tRNA (N6-threonylcarbamoyladenosine(37)-N6)-methyltransferase TrmO [Actinomycetota bacterium]|nr:tRNA (N6-threonylcarbamoyladenosine(37)-N6)-methyltransferase TrmO [Actinomycetota bacterium]
METYTISPIGIIHTPYKSREQAPRQAAYSNGAKAIIDIYPKYLEGLKGLAEKKYIIVLFYFNRNKDYRLTARPPGQDHRRGIFATRSPHRPNHLGMSVVRLEKVEGTRIYVRDVDMLDGTPVIDIKPYVADLDCRQDK